MQLVLSVTLCISSPALSVMSSVWRKLEIIYLSPGMNGHRFSMKVPTIRSSWLQFSPNFTNSLLVPVGMLVLLIPIGMYVCFRTYPVTHFMAYETWRFNAAFTRIPILSWINLVPCINTYISKICSSTVPPIFALVFLEVSFQPTPNTNQIIWCHLWLTYQFILSSWCSLNNIY